MPRDPSGPSIVGDGLTSRISRRAEQGGLQRMSMPGGGVAYRGEIATRALNAVGARAMTLDRSIVVGDDFDPSRPEDQALFAHERYHAEHGDGGGGGGGENFRDAEEIAARAVERMVLHRAVQGGYEGGYQPGAGGGAPTPSADKAGGTVSAGAQGADERPDSRKGKADPAKGYAAMLAQGMSHSDIVDELARRVLDGLEAGHQVKQERAGDIRGTI